MADVAAFSACVGRLGFNAVTTAYITGQGLSTIDELQGLPTADIDAMMLHMTKTRPPAPAGGGQAVDFTFLAVRRLKALRAWCDYRTLRGQEPTPALFINATIPKWVKRITELDEARRAKKDDLDLKAPEAFASMTKWPSWEELFKTYLYQHRSVVAGTPLAYVIRDHDDVTPEMLAEVYAKIDDDLVATSELTGDTYSNDNQRVYDLLKPLIIQGPGWPFIQPFNRSRDGRAAFRRLKAQAEGTSAIATRKAQAYALITTARYSGKGKTFSIDQYVARHQRAHNDLLDMGEPIPEGKKVVDFLAGITDSKLEIAKGVIDGDDAKLNNFELCQQYIKTVAMNAAGRSTVNVDTRTVAEVGSGKDPAKSRTKKRKAAADTTSADMKPSGIKVHAGQYAAKDYHKLKPFEKAEVRRMRAERDSAGGSRTVATVASSGESSPAADSKDATPPTNNTTKNAGSQFGRNAHKKQGQPKQD